MNSLAKIGSISFGISLIIERNLVHKLAAVITAFSTPFIKASERA